MYISLFYLYIYLLIYFCIFVFYLCYYYCYYYYDYYYYCLDVDLKCIYWLVISSRTWVMHFMHIFPFFYDFVNIKYSISIPETFRIKLFELHVRVNYILLFTRWTVLKPSELHFTLQSAYYQGLLLWLFVL